MVSDLYKETNGLRFESGYYRQSRTKFMKQCQEIKKNWTGRENFDICLSVIFKKTGY